MPTSLRERALQMTWDMAKQQILWGCAGCGEQVRETGWTSLCTAFQPSLMVSNDRNCQNSTYKITLTGGLLHCALNITQQKQPSFN
jgi:hypothetical protein